MGEAFLWGIVAGSSLVVGGVIALRLSISQRLLGLIMAFGSGVLISAVAYDSSTRRSPPQPGRRDRARPPRGLGRLLRRGGDDRPSNARRSGELERGGHACGETGRAVTLGIVLDGIPESLVLGLTVLEPAPSASRCWSQSSSRTSPRRSERRRPSFRRGGTDQDHPLLGTRSHRLRRYVPRGLRRARFRIAANRRHRARIRGWRSPDDAREHDDAGGPASRRQARRLCHDARLRARVCDQRDSLARTKSSV